MVSIQPNLVITREDIETNSELWIQKISVILFNDVNGKNYWNKNYTFIPHYQRYSEAVKWIKDTKFHEYSCRITANLNNEIEIVTQNLFGDRRVLLDKERELLGKIRVKIYQEINRVNDSFYQKELEKGLRLDTNIFNPFHNYFLFKFSKSKRHLTDEH